MAEIAVFTVGCKVNQAESEELRMDLASAGHNITGDPATADLCVVNTCTVTAESDRKCRKLVRWLQRRGAKSIVVAGCYAEVNPGDAGRLPGVVAVLPNSLKDTWIQRICSMIPAASGTGEDKPHRSRGFIKVQDGCERGCSYCIVPRARGAERSRGPREVLEVVARWLKAGAAEVVLCGINLGRYRGGDGYDLAALVGDVLSAGEGFRVRLSSIELEDLKVEWLQEWSKSSRICPHIHLPLQSGDAAILHDMGRGYGPEEYVETARILRSTWPQASLTSEVIVGYPGEGENAFRATLEVLNEVRPARLHVFRFSPRPGTRAWDMAAAVPAQEAERRSAEMRALAEEWRIRYIEEHRGEQRGMLVERLIRHAGCETATGTTEDYMKAVMPDPPEGTRPGSVVSAVITGVSGGRALMKTA